MQVCNDNASSESSSEAGISALNFREQTVNVPKRIGLLRERLDVRIRSHVSSFLDPNGSIANLEKQLDQTLAMVSDARSAGVDASLASENKARLIRGAGQSTNP